MTPGPRDLWFLPLGGCGEIGMNLNLYGHDGSWLMVDCGVTFRKPGEPGGQVQMPDPAFIAARREQLAALVLTHGHEDHIGAVAHLWPQLRCPVYATPFAAALLRGKLVEAGLEDAVPLHVVPPGASLHIGPFEVQWWQVNHSTPESNGLLIRSAAGNVFHTGDWKLDAEPLLEPSFAAAHFGRLAQQGIVAMVCDSTNATVAGRSHSEGELVNGLHSAVEAARGRVVVGCFGSNVARLQTLARIGVELGRRPALLGRSLFNYHRAARQAGVWDPQLQFIDANHLGYLPAEEVLCIATGSQGEPNAALQRLAAGAHPAMELQPGDRVIMSSRTIPGNEVAVASLTDRLRAMGVDVLHSEDSPVPIHASGHPAQEELRAMYQWVQPRVAIPVHGEERHMRANAAIAKASGVPEALRGLNGDLFVLAPQRMIRRRAAAVGRISVAGR